MRRCAHCGVALTKPRQRLYCSRGHALAATRPPLRGAENPRFNGGLCQRADGRWVIHCRDNSLMYFYRGVMAAQIGRLLRPDELVHHVNGDPADDRPENLRIVSRAEHIVMHRAQVMAGRQAA